MEDDPNSTANAPDDIGYARPPRRTRFKPGSSGNPWGRPKRKHREAPYEHLLGRLVTITEAGAERKVTAAEAFLLQLTKRGLEGDNVAARATMRAIEEMRAHGTTKPDDILSICRQIVSPGSVNGALEVLRMAELVEGYSSDNARILLAPWIVEAALVRMASVDRLTAEQLEIIKNATMAAKNIR